MDASIPIRRPNLRLAPIANASPGEAIPRHWHAAGPFATHFYDALSSTFPFGEAFFVRSVLAYRDELGDDLLEERIRGFAGQEGQHSRLHDEHMTLLLQQGYRLLARRNRFVDRMLRFHNRRTPRLSLAITAALEHLTAILARQLLADGARHTHAMHPTMGRLWRWHALEEAEHKAVAFDVLVRVAPSRSLRRVAMAIDTFFLAFETLLRTAYMLAKDGLLFERGVWREGVRFLVGRSGLLRGTAAEYRAWYRADFHPDAIDDASLIARARRSVLPEIAVTGPGTSAPA